MRSEDTYSDLEGLVLCMLGLGHSNGYSMRRQLMLMRGHRQSVESGSVYRVLYRLANQGLVREVARGDASTRNRIEFEITDSGREVLQSWLQRVPNAEDLEDCQDPLRVRTHFLGLLDPVPRYHLIRTWISQNKSHVQALRQECAAAEETPCWRSAALRGLLIQAEARQEWLRKLLEQARAEVTEPVRVSRSRRGPKAAANRN